MMFRFSEFQHDETCDIECFPPTWGYPAGTTGPSSINTINYDQCHCMCREPFDRKESGPNCVCMLIYNCFQTHEGHAS